MKEFMAIAKALADENRTRTVLFLRSGELCVCQIMQMLGLAPSTVSKHLDILHQAGLIESRKNGRWVYYRLNDNPSPCAKNAIDWLAASLDKDKQIANDSREIKAVRKMNKEELCCRYKQSCGA